MPALEDKNSAVPCLLRVLQKYTDPQHPLNNGQLIEKLQQEYKISITPNTLRHHLDCIEAIGYPISRHQDNGKGVYLEPDEPKYEDEEVRILVDGVLTSRFISASHAGHLIRKLTKPGRKNFPKQLNHIRPIDDWNHRNDQSFFLHLGDLTEAVSERKFVEFHYCDIATDKKLIHKRNKKDCVIPLSVVCSQGQYYLIARYPKIVLIVSKMPANLAGDILDRFGDRAKMLDQGDGTMEVHVFATEEGMRFFALQYGASGCEVIHPQSLREQVKWDILSLMHRYRLPSDQKL